MKTLEQVKEKYAQSVGYKYWVDLLNDDELELSEIYDHYDQVALEMATQVIDNTSKESGCWIICNRTYFFDGVEIPKGRMKFTNARFPTNGFWSLASDTQIKTKKKHKGNYFNPN